MPTEPPIIEIRAVDPADHDEMVQFQRVYEEAETAEFADGAIYTLEDGISVLSRAPLGRLYRGYAAFEGGRMVGESMILASTVDNLRTARFWVWVPPSERGRGVGRALADHVIGECRSLGRDILQTSAKYPFERREDHHYRRFAERLGFALANTEVERRLQLPVAHERLDALAAEARVRHEDYSVVPVVGPIPADLAQGYCDVHNRLTVEAPGGDLVLEESRRTPEILADQENEIREQKRTRVSALALTAGGIVVALTSAVTSPTGHPGVNQWATIVRPDHRGHRLGMAVKVAQIRAIQSSFPEKSYITTTNAETNAHMVAINEALGFERRALEGEFQRAFSAEGPDPVPEQGGARVP